MEKIKSQQLNFTPENIFRLKQVAKSYNFDVAPDLKECELFEVLYLAVVDPALRAIGVIEKGEPYFVWQELNYEASILQAAIDSIVKALGPSVASKQ